jgi:beta-alanine--pyruvate transaminase
MPFTYNRAFKAQPLLLSSAQDMYYYTPDGRPVLDGTAGLWCVNAGHTRRKITEAIQAQAEQADFLPAFQVGHPAAFQLANRLAALLPEPLNHVFFSNSGSEAVDSALKIALAYHRSRGDGARTRLIGRARGYHGVGFGGISVGGIGANRRPYGPLLPGVDHLRATHFPDQPFVRGQPAHGVEFADDLEGIVALHGADTIAAVIVEPLAGSTGVLPPPKGYLERLREICDRYGILLIFDEVITAFGRLGAPTAAAYFGVTPDLICMAKGLTNAAVPMGAVGVHDKIYEAVVAAAAAPGIELFHGYTYSGHPLACAAGLAALDIYHEEGLFERAASLAQTWQDAVHGLQGARHVIDVRNLGLVAGIELEPRPKEPGARALQAFRSAFEKGLLIRVTADIVALSPPLIVTESQISEMVTVLRNVLEATA